MTIKQLMQKDSVEISVESKNNSEITKNNAREERAIATNATEDIWDKQNNSDINRIKNYAKKPGNQLYHNLSKDTWQRSNSQSNTSTKNASKNAVWCYKSMKIFFLDPLMNILNFLISNL